MPVSVADAIFWIAVASCAVAQLAILHSIVVSPTRAALRGQAAGSTAQRAIEIFWAVLPGLALAAVFFFTWRAMHPLVVSSVGVASAVR
ncbi:MAG TPA: hypothetical protein VHB25_12080 [Gemmatimonadaceae bacterium]|nr:hypothetical protein [Gemmatimonadaceae bacterium]